MIAQIKTLANAKEIEIKQKEYQEIAQKNEKAWEHNRVSDDGDSMEVLNLPIVPDAIYKPSDLLIDIEYVSLAFVNSTGEISIKYHGDNFNLIYSDEVWEALKNRFTKKKCEAACNSVSIEDLI